MKFVLITVLYDFMIMSNLC